MNKNLRIIIIVITFIWVGLLFRISFIEAPLKFQAPNITLPLGLGIGKIVFAALNKIEILFSIILISSFWLGKISIKSNPIYLVVLLILLIQSVGLLPILDERADAIIAGQDITETYHHVVYIVLEIIKIILLLVAGIKFLKR